MKRVVVTGMGLVTPFGCGKSQNWNSLISAKSGATKITKFDSTKYKCQVACEVPIGNGENGTFNAEDWIEKKEVKSISVTKNNLPDLLGVPPYQRLEIEKEDLVGITTGLAWTEVGGELLSIEAVKVLWEAASKIDSDLSK